jgi:hypothetical protein
MTFMGVLAQAPWYIVGFFIGIALGWLIIGAVRVAWMWTLKKLGEFFDRFYD